MSSGKIRIGVGGWTYEPWRGVFFPKGLSQKGELSYASRNLSSIEINGTFYRTQSPTSFNKWFDSTPDDFVFSVKGPMYATNKRVLAEAGESIERFLESGVRNLKQKLGPINWQFAATKKFDPADFEAFLKLLPSDLKNAVEVRNESFRCEQFVELARKFQVAIALSGDSAYPMIPDITAPFVYARIMGTTEEENGYSESQLDVWAQRAKSLAAGIVPNDMPLVSSSKTEPSSRDAFIYVISGFKQANPAAAMELMTRVWRLGK